MFHESVPGLLYNCNVKQIPNTDGEKLELPEIINLLKIFDIILIKYFGTANININEYGTGGV